jgi:hypothetical protein
MRKTPIIVLLAAALLLGGWTLWPRKPVQAGGPPENTGIGPLVAGTYLLGPFPELGTFTADGSYVLTHAASFGDHPAAAFLSPEHGAWRQTGPRQVTSRSLSFAFGDDGKHFATTRVDVVWDFDDATFGSGMLTLLSTDIFFADQDPLDPDEEPFLSIPGGDTAGFRRIAVP